LRRLLAHGQKCVPTLRGATLLGSFSGLRPATEHRDYQISWTSCDNLRGDAPGGISVSAPSTGASGKEAVSAPGGEAVSRTGRNLAPVVETKRPEPTDSHGTGWISVAGIRSTGLSCAPGIGEYVAELCIGLRDRTPPVHASAGAAAFSDVAGVSGLAASSDVAGVSSRAAVNGHVPPADGCAVGITEAALRPVPLEPAPRRLNGPVPPLAALAAEYRRRGDGRVTLYGRLRRVTHPVTSFGLQTMGVHDQG
jgi:hypothetical protein